MDSETTVVLNSARRSAGGVLSPRRLSRSVRPSHLSAETRALYHAIARYGVVPAEQLEPLTGNSGADTLAALRELEDLGLVEKTPSGLVAVPASLVIDKLAAEQTALVAATLQQIQEGQRKLGLVMGERDALSVDDIERWESIPSTDDRDIDSIPFEPTSEISAVHPGRQFDPELLDQSRARAAAQLQAGVRLRVVHQTSALAQPHMLAYLQAVEKLGGRIRLRDHLPFRLMIIDGRVAVCSLPAPGTPSETILLRGSRMMTLVDRVFEATWIDATPLEATGLGPEAVEPGPAGTALALTSQQIAILKYLAEGHTDQVIARTIGVTLRTVTRRIAEIYGALGVTSRFQAGAAARRLGLI